MRKTHLQQSGFTLVELMVAIAILAILAAIAYPNYQTYIQRARMEAARTELVDNIKMLEKRYSQNMHICETANADKSACTTFPTPIEIDTAEHYDVTIQANPHSNNVSNYVLISQPNNKANYSTELLGKKELIWVYYSDTATFAKCTSSGKSDSLSKKTNSTSSGEVSICLTS